MPRRAVTTALLAGVLVFAACGDDSGSGDSLDGRRFRSSAVEGRQLVPGTSVDMRFDDGSITVNAGCNTISGRYELDDDTLATEQLATTEMGCEPGLMDQDAWIAEMIAARPRVASDDTSLRLTGDTVIIDFVDAEVADPDRSLEGTIWVVDGLIDGDSVSSVPAGVEASLTLTGELAIYATGCNDGSGGYSVSDDGTEVTFDPQAVLTLQACSGPADDVERHYFSVVNGTARVEIDAARLTMRNGERGLTFVAQE